MTSVLLKVDLMAMTPAAVSFGCSGTPRKVWNPSGEEDFCVILESARLCVCKEVVVAWERSALACSGGERSGGGSRSRRARRHMVCDSRELRLSSLAERVGESRELRLSSLVKSISSLGVMVSHVGKKKLCKMKRKKKKAFAASLASAGSEVVSARDAAIKYLHDWKQGNHAWKFSKLRQSFLLRNWADSALLPIETFETLIAYLDKLPQGPRTRTIEQATTIAQEEFEQSEYNAELDAGQLEERKTNFQTRRVRALKVLSALCDDL